MWAHRLLWCLGMVPLLAIAATPASGPLRSGLDEVEAYAQAQGTTGLLIMRDGKVLLERNWPLAAGNERFRDLMTYGPVPDGSLLEDVASQQKSFIAVLAGIAADHGLLDAGRSVTSYIGPGWSKATPEQEAQILVLNLLQMNSGLADDFTYEAPPGARFRYNTPVYAVLIRVLESATREPLDRITRDWLTGPLQMSRTTWRQRPAALARAGNARALVSTPRDESAFGEMILHRGIGPDGQRIISTSQLEALFAPSPTNPAYGRLWWLNGSRETISVLGKKREGPLIASAPADLVAALGLFDRKLYVVPSAGLVVVRFGMQAQDGRFDERFWELLSAALHLTTL